MRWPAAPLTNPDRRANRLLLFAAAELLLAMAIPFLLIRGYHALLDSRSGTVVDAPTRAEPGWSAVVAATPITAVVETEDGSVTGVALLVAGSDSPAEPSGGTVMLVPGDLHVGGKRQLSDLDPGAAVTAVTGALRVAVVDTVVADDHAWAQALGPTSYSLDNIDPVPAPDGLAFAVGPVAVDGSNVGPYLGRPVEGAPLSSLLFRRTQLWQAMVDQPPAGDGALAALVVALGAGSVQVVGLPTAMTDNGSVVEAVEAERLIREVVPYPSGDRLKLRIVDRTGAADLEGLAAQLAGRGVEVVEIANAVQFDDGGTEVIVPAGLAADTADTASAAGAADLEELTRTLGVQPLIDHEQETHHVTLLVGSGLDLGSPG